MKIIKKVKKLIFLKEFYNFVNRSESFVMTILQLSKNVEEHFFLIFFKVIISFFFVFLLYWKFVMKDVDETLFSFLYVGKSEGIWSFPLLHKIDRKLWGFIFLMTFNYGFSLAKPDLLKVFFLVEILLSIHLACSIVLNYLVLLYFLAWLVLIINANVFLKIFDFFMKLIFSTINFLEKRWLKIVHSLTKYFNLKH